MRNKLHNSFYNRYTEVPFFLPYIDKSDISAVENALKSTILTNGPKLVQFESSFKKLTKSKFAIGVSNATSALHLSLKAIGIKSGDEVIVPDLTFAATANAVLLSGGTPVIADIDEDTMNISSTSIKKSVSKKTKAIIPVHFAGLPCQMDEIIEIANSYSLKIIEDCAHAIGSKYNSKHVGTFGKTGCFSFYPTKNISTIEGGMIITDDKKIANYVSLVRNHGITRTLTQRYSKAKPWEYDIHEPGYNYRLDEIRSALGLSQLKKLKFLNQKRKNAFIYYNEGLKNTKGLVTPFGTDFRNHACHLYIIKILNNAKITRDTLYKTLLKNNIITSVHYRPLHKFSIFKKKGIIRDKLITSNKIFNQILSLPLYPNISNTEQDLVIKSIKDVL